MEISFQDVSAADAGLLARELSLALKRDGVPGDAIRVTRSSPESMDLGSLLTIDFSAVLQALGAAGSIASFGRCIYDMVARSGVTIQIHANGESAKLPQQLDLEKIEEVLRRLNENKKTDA